LKKALFLSVFTGLALIACLDNSIAPAPVDAGSKGSARIKLPVVPEKALAKTGFRIASAYTIYVTVSGPGMSPRTQAWDLAALGGQTVTLEDIPSGADRVFTGWIVRDSIKTHEGSYVVSIGGGETVFVPLVLRDVRSGRAEICIEVEGWPTPKCTPIDTLPVEPVILSGCWHIEANDGNTYLNGTLSIFSMEGSLHGNFIAANGFRYFANPAFVNGVWRVSLEPSIIDPGFGGDWNAKLIRPVDTLVSPDDSTWHRTFHLRVDNIQSGLHAGPVSILSGAMMDPSFTVVRGGFKGVFTACGEVVDVHPVDTTWVDTILIDNNLVDDMRNTTRPVPGYRPE
jgi:hypothetical protein